MTAIRRITLFGVLAVLLFDAVASLASRHSGFDYAQASTGSYLIYGITGFFAARAAGSRGAISAGIVLGLVDATIGWGISWLLGPGRPADTATFTPWTVPVVVIMVTITAVLCALVGALLQWMVRRKSQAA